MLNFQAVCIYIYIHIHMNMYVYLNIKMHVYIWLCWCIYMYIYIRNNINRYIYIYVTIYRHIYTHIYIYIYIYIHESWITPPNQVPIQGCSVRRGFRIELFIRGLRHWTLHWIIEFVSWLQPCAWFITQSIGIDVHWFYHVLRGCSRHLRYNGKDG